MHCPKKKLEAEIKLSETGGVADCSLWKGSQPGCGGECLSGPRARDVMQKEVISVRDTLLLTELSRLLNARRISGAPVLDSRRRLVGVVSCRDLMSGRGPGFFATDMMVDELLDGFTESKARVRDVMSEAVHRVEESAPLTEVVEVMLREHIHRVIVTRDGTLAGIITTTDLMKVLAGLLRVPVR